MDNYELNCTISFIPAEWEAINSVYDSTKATKRIADGQLLIERNGRTYNTQGVEIK